MNVDVDPTAEARSQLVHELHEIRLRLERYAGIASGASPIVPVAAPNSPLEQVCEAFDLDPFERAILVMCAGIEFDSGFAQLCGKVNGDPTQTFVTFGLAMATMPNPFWAAASPAMSLRRWNLVEMSEAPSLARTPVRIDEAVLHFVLDGFFWDAALEGVVRPLEGDATVVPSHAKIGQAVAAVMTGGSPPLIQLVGPGATERRSVAAAAAAEAELTPFLISTHAVPISARDRARLARRWDRLARLLGAVLVIEETQGGADADQEQQTAARLLAEAIEGPVIVSRRSRMGAGERPSVLYEIGYPVISEQRALWGEALSLDADDPLVLDLAGTFDLGGDAIVSAAAAAASRKDEAPEIDPVETRRRIWDAARAQLRPDLESLAQRVDCKTGWDGLVVAPKTLASLREIADQTRLRTRVIEQWGFGRRGARGQGIVALFSGGSGVGKTLAAEVIAHEVGLDLFRIDLSAVVDKYIGETEKNLARLFDAADGGGSILFFDEADALFGKRSEVKEGKDRYANIEVGYLLQRLETYRGLAILSTNLKDGLDAAFTRRLRFLVDFGFPDQVARLALWRVAFPPEAPLNAVAFDALAELQLSGGQIASIAVNAAYLAAAADLPIGMDHVLAACRREYGKTSQILDHPLLKPPR